MEEKKKSNKLKVIIPVVVAIVILAIVGIVFFTGNNGNKKILSMAKIETAKYLSAKDKDFKKIVFINAETIETNGNIVSIYGWISYKDIYGGTPYAQFEGKFENKNNELIAKYLRVGFNTLLNK